MKRFLPWIALGLCFLVFSVAEAREQQFSSPYFCYGGSEGIKCEENIIISAEVLPSYNDFRNWQRAGDMWRLSPDAPLSGSYAIAYASGNSFIFEVVLDFDHFRYFHALLYYPDGRTPHLFVKQRAGGKVAFLEEPIDASWLPERLFPGFQGKIVF